MRIEDILQRSGAILQGHFLLSSGNHSPHYVQCSKLFENPSYGDLIGNLIAEKIKKYNPEVVIGPAMGGVILSYVVARSLRVRSLFSERESGVMKLRRNFALQRGERVAIVEDVTTTGGSVKEVIEVVRNLGAEVCCVASIINRSSRNPFEMPFEFLVEMNLVVYKPYECPQCKSGIPLIKPGSRSS